MKVRIEPYIDPILVGEDSVWDNNTYLIADSSMVKASWKYLFIDSETFMYVDWNNQINKFFEISENGDGTYRFYGAAYNGEKGGAFTPSNYADCYVGVKIVNGVPDKVLTPILSSIDPDEGVVNCID